MINYQVVAQLNEGADSMDKHKQFIVVVENFKDVRDLVAGSLGTTSFKIMSASIMEDIKILIKGQE